MGELEFEQKALVKAVDQALVEQTREVGELRLNTPGGRFQQRWDEGGSATALGQLAFFAQFLEVSGSFERWVAGRPLAYTSPYNRIHDIYEAEGWATPKVSLNGYCSDLYWADKLLLDLLCLREQGIAQEDAVAHLRSKNRAFEDDLRQARLPLRKDLAAWLGAGFKWVINRFCRFGFDLNLLGAFPEVYWQSSRRKVLDFLALDYYDPFTAHIFRLPVWWDHEGGPTSLRRWIVNAVSSKWWDWHVLPGGMRFFCEYYARDLGQRPVLIAENGLAIRRCRDNTHSPRRDRMTRSEFLRCHVAEVIAMRKRGLPLLGYLHWSLFDNYEWGT